MQELINYLMTQNPVVKGSQYSFFGNWEDAIKIDLDNTYIINPNETIDASVAVEVFYELSDGRMVFLGLRYSYGLVLANSPEVFLKKVLKVIETAKQINFETLINELGESLNNEPQTYSQKPVGYVELGVEGFWKSERPLILRKSTDPKLDKLSLESMLEQHGNLVGSIKNHIAIEFAIEKPEGWIGVQVSNKIGDTFNTDIDKLLTLANLI